MGEGLVELAKDARRVVSVRGLPSPAKKRHGMARTTAGHELNAADVRAWAREAGKVISEKGRIPSWVFDEYASALLKKAPEEEPTPVVLPAKTDTSFPNSVANNATITFQDREIRKFWEGDEPEINPTRANLIAFKKAHVGANRDADYKGHRFTRNDKDQYVRFATEQQIRTSKTPAFKAPSQRSAGKQS
jgi:hypothetical protein